MKMENISESVMMCMIAVAALQFLIIFIFIKSGANNKDSSDFQERKKNLIELINRSPACIDNGNGK